LEKIKLIEKLECFSNKTNATILLKGVCDLIVKNKQISELQKGNESLTKGGTGDILVGFIAGLIAQKMEAYDSAKLATKKLDISQMNFMINLSIIIWRRIY